MSLAIVAVVLAVGLLAFQALTGAEFQQRMDRQHAEARAYCDQVFGEGDYVLYNAMVMGHHGGYHCESESGETVHLHDITDEAKAAALEAELAGESVDWSSIKRYEDWHQRGYWQDMKALAGLLALAIFVPLAIKYAPGRVGGRA